MVLGSAVCRLCGTSRQAISSLFRLSHCAFPWKSPDFVRSRDVQTWNLRRDHWVDIPGAHADLLPFSNSRITEQAIFENEMKIFRVLSPLLDNLTFSPVFLNETMNFHISYTKIRPLFHSQHFENAFSKIEQRLSPTLSLSLSRDLCDRRTALNFEKFSKKKVFGLFRPCTLHRIESCSLGRAFRIFPSSCHAY